VPEWGKKLAKNAIVWALATHINLAIVPINTRDANIAYNKTYFEEIGRKLDEYFLEVSYYTLYVDFQVYNRSDGSWCTVPQSTQYYRERRDAFFSDAIASCDDIIDFRKYDYEEEYGKGIVAFITAEDIWLKGPFTLFYLGNTGVFRTSDGVRVDVIYIPLWRFEGDPDREVRGDKIIRGLAHEFAHALGKLLVTSVSSSAKDCSWVLPDLYLRGNVTKRWDLMGNLMPRGSDAREYLVERVHLSSYSKEWLGWLKYRDTWSGGTYTIKSLVKMRYGDEVLRYMYKKVWWEVPNFYLFELRTNLAEYSQWDTETLYPQVLAIYQVDVRFDFPWECRPDAVNLVRTLVASGQSFSDPDIAVTFRVVNITAEKATISIETFSGKGLVGVSVIPFGNVISSVYNVLPTDAIAGEYMRIPLPDIDLHVYTEDGRHVGINYETGSYEVAISGALASGDLINGREWIFVPDNVSVHFVVSSRDVETFLNALPSAKAYTNGTETYAITLIYYDPNGTRYESLPVIQQIPPGEMLEHGFEIIRNPNGTYTVIIHRGRTHALAIDVKPSSRKIVNRGVLNVHTNVTAVGGNINSFTLQYIFNNTEIINYKPFGKITYELYDERGNLIEKGTLGDFNSTVVVINKLVPEGYTIVVKTHFEIQVRKNGAVEIAVKSKAGAVTKTAKTTFIVERKK
jgi:hypothetical protein